MLFYLDLSSNIIFISYHIPIIFIITFNAPFKILYKMLIIVYIYIS